MAPGPSYLCSNLTLDSSTSNLRSYPAMDSTTYTYTCSTYDAAVEAMDMSSDPASSTSSSSSPSTKLQWGGYLPGGSVQRPRRA